MFWNLDKVILSESTALPVDWDSIMPSGRIFVEIGFGNGEFLEYLAGTYKDVLIVGVEVSQMCASKGARRILAAGFDNVRIMHGDARFLLRCCFRPESVERVFMNFPCPWPKARHASRRVTVPVFADLLNYILKPGGTFELATDVDWYAEEAAKNIAESGAFDVDPIEIDPVRPYITKYERKWKSMGKSTWHLTLHKNGRVVPERYGDDDWQMEVETCGGKTVSEILGILKNTEGTGIGNMGHWIFRDAFISDDGVGLVLVITADEGFEQHFYLKLINNGRGVTVKVDSVGHPYKTPAMRGAIRQAIAAASSSEDK